MIDTRSFVPRSQVREEYDPSDGVGRAFDRPKGAAAAVLKFKAMAADRATAPRCDSDLPIVHLLATYVGTSCTICVVSEHESLNRRRDNL